MSPEKTRRVCKIVLSLGLLLTLTTVVGTSVLARSELQHPLTSPQLQPQTLQTHALIWIKGDSEFTADRGVTGGTGTTSDPYVIQGWSIDLSPYQTASFPPQAGISIERTTAEFVIRNVKVSGGLSASASIGVTTPCYLTQNGIPGIMLSHVQNGIVQNSESDQNSVGVYLDHSTANSITGNVLQGNECGVFLFVSNYNTVSSNTATGLCCNPLTWDNGFGFHLFGSSNNTLSHNSASNAGIGFTVSAIRTTYVIDFRSYGNTLADNTASYSQADGFFLNQTDHNILESNTAEKTTHAFGVDGVGFNLYATVGESLTGNLAVNNVWGGFLLKASTGDFLKSNTATGSTVTGIIAYGAGFGFLKSDMNTLVSNDAYGNHVGFAVTTSSLHNRFTSNLSHDNSEGFDMSLSSNLNVFDHNRVYRNLNGFALSLQAGDTGDSSETFAYNTVSGNALGFQLGTSTNQTILGNLIFDNNMPNVAYGVILTPSMGIALTGVINSRVISNVIFNNQIGVQTAVGILQGGGNMIYNNFFSNPENTNVDPNAPDSWNVTEKAGTNLIGGSLIGGNFWSDYTGTDQDNDGIGDSSYYPETCVGGLCNRWGQTLGRNIDHLPLVFAPPSGTMADFTLASSTSSTVDQGSNATFVLAFLSRNSFSGTLSLSATISPSIANGPVIAFKPSTINLPAGGTVAAAANVTNTMIPGTYNIDITATSASTSHTITVQLTIAAVSNPSPTITTVACNPPTVALSHATSCTATVADISQAATMSPTGTVTFNPGGTCTLAGTGAATCSVTLTPTTSGTLQISATYAGSPTNALSKGGTIITVTIETTATAITCTPSTVSINQASTCTTTVTDTSQGTTSTPTGTVAWATTNSGTFGLMACTLAGTYASASCYVTYTPTTTGSHHITGTYSGDTTHPTSFGTTTVTVVSPAFDFQLSTPAPASLTVVRASTSTTSWITATLTSGTAAPVTFSVTSTLPAGVTAGFNYNPCSPSCAASVYFSATATATLGTTTVTIQATGGGVSHVQSLYLAVDPQPSPFDYSLSVMPNAASIVVGASTSFTITATLIGGTGQPVILAGSISPQLMVCQPVYGVSPCGTVTLSPPTVTPTSAGATSTVTISTTNIVPPGTYTLTMAGSPSGTSSPSAVFTLTVRMVGLAGTSVGVVCSPGSSTIGSSSSCTATVTGSSPNGLVTFSVVGSNGGMVTLADSSCTLYSGSCSVSLTGLAAGTATVTAAYSGDASNLGSSGSSSVTVQKPANAVASNSVSSTLTGGKVSTDQTSVTGVSVSITGSTAADGTSVTMVTQHLSSLSTGVGPINLNNAAYYDVLVSGVSNGNAIVCITDRSTTSATTMMYWDGKAWANASGALVAGSQVCGTIPVTALTGTNVVVGDVVPPFFTPTLLLIVALIVVSAIAAAAVLVLSRRRTTMPNHQQ